MAHLIIKKIGPVQEVDIDLNKVNVIIGPQSSGKSTIAKIISHCQWVEKKRMSEGYTYSDFVPNLMSFHHIDVGYFATEGSLIEYKGDFVHLKVEIRRMNNKSYNANVAINRIGDELEYQQYKITYIPAERNFVAVIPGLARYKGSDDNIMNYIYDWFEAKTLYEFPILNLGVSYYVDKKTEIDKIVVQKGKADSVEINMNTASSGLQSITPLLLILNNNSNTIYKTQHSLSVLEKRKMDELRKEEKYDERKLDSNRKSYHYSQYIVEEPEQNLFPETQRDLLYKLLQTVLLRKKDSMTITTHSPYILYALNNCMMGYLVQNDLSDIEKEKLKSCGSWIDSNLVSAWEITTEGKLVSMKSSRLNTIGEQYFNEIMNEIMDEYYIMLKHIKRE